MKNSDGLGRASLSIPQILQTLGAPSVDEGAIDRYIYRSQNSSLLLPALQRLFVGPLKRILADRVTPEVMIALNFLFIGTCFYLALEYRGRYPYITLPAIACLTFAYLLGDTLLQPLSRMRGRVHHLTTFLQHYLQTFAVGFFSLMSIALFVSNEAAYGPIVLMAAHLSYFLLLQEYSHRKIYFYVDRFGGVEALILLITLSLISIPRPIFWKIITPLQIGLSPLDGVMAIIVLGAFATGIRAIYRSKLYLAPATLLYASACLLFVIMFYTMKNSLFVMVLFVLYSSAYFGRMILARMISPEERNPYVMPVILALVGMQLEHRYSDTPFVGYIFLSFLIGDHLLLTLQAFTRLRSRHQVGL